MTEETPNRLGTPDDDGDLNPKFSPERKIEVTGGLLIVIGFLLFLSIVSNSESDYTQVSGFGLLDLITTDQSKIPIVQNWLGILGAIVSHHFIYNFLGYPVVIITLLIMIWGWVMLRHHGLTKPTYLTVYGIIFNLIISTFSGLVAIISSTEVTGNAWSGLIGIFLGSLIFSILGSIGGTIFVLAAFFAVLTLFINLNLKQFAATIQKYIQKFSGKTYDSISDTVSKTVDNFPSISSLTDKLSFESKPESEKVIAEKENIIQEEKQDEAVSEELLNKFRQDPEEEKSIARENTKERVHPKEAEPKSGVVSSRKIGIPLDEILPPVIEQRNEVLKPVTEEIHIDEFKGLHDDLIPVEPGMEKVQTQFTELEVPEDSVETILPEEKLQPKRSDNLAGYLKTKLGTEKQEIEDRIPESENPNAAIEKNEIESVISDETVIEFIAETEIPEVKSDAYEIPLIEVQTENPVLNEESDFAETSNEKPNNESSIELDIKVVEEEKAKGPRDPIIKFGYRKPGFDLLKENKKSVYDVINREELEENKRTLISKLKTYGIEIEGRMEATIGPKVTLYEFKPAEGIKVSRITGLADDIALAMAAKGIRIMAPVPGKALVGVEIPNRESVDVLLREVLESEKFKEASDGKKNSDGTWNKEPMLLPIALGRTIENLIYIEDLAKLPHLLVAGTTGSGKSVGINTIICSLLYHSHPQNLKFVMIDPKRVELSIYKSLEKHFLAILPELNEPILTDTSKAVTLLRAVEREMDQRYDLLARNGVRHLKDFNRKVESGEIKQVEGDPYVKLPFIVVIIDELADLMMTAGKEVEEPIARIAQLARAVGIHLVVATQRPSVDVITGLIKANFPARIAYQVTSKIDSRTILDMNGADQLLGNGDMLYLPNGSPKPIRIQNAFVSTDECDKIIEHIAKQPGFVSAYRLPTPVDKNAKGPSSRSESSDSQEWDELLTEAAYMVVQHEQGSTSLLQRRLRIGYSRAARIIDQLEVLGIVGPPDGSKARQVTVSDESMLKDILDTM